MATLTISPSMARERNFFALMSLIILAVVLVGFSRSYYLQSLFPTHPRPAETFFALHGAVFTGWFLLMAAQPQVLRHYGRQWHQRLGWAGAVIAVMMIPLGIHGSLIAAARPTGFIGVPLSGPHFLIVPLTDLLMFATFVTLGVWWRKRAAAHKRLMVLASLSILTAALARWPMDFMQIPPVHTLILLLFILAIGLFDRRQLGRIHPVTMWGGLAIVIVTAIRIPLGGTEAWLSIADTMLH